MASQYNKYFSRRNLNFLLHEVFHATDVTKHPYYNHFDKESFEMVVDAAVQIAENISRPANDAQDRDEAELEHGTIRVHPLVRKYMQAAGEAGFISANAPLDLGGSQMPVSLISATGYILSAANNGITSFAGLTNGAANLIVSFGSDALKEKYLPKMFAGEWQGTMCLTEPQAGSSLHYITTSASPAEDGSFRIKGQKIYITCGDHDQTENVIHLVLARIDGAPLGTKGISLFVVPKKRFGANGELVPNDVKTVGIFHKMGQKGSPAAHIGFGDNEDCHGWLVGEPHRGLSYMFQMMNEARIGVGTTGAAIASAAYYASLQYANERPQGQKLTTKGTDPAAPQTLIINHPDVKRMLLFQKAVVEASASLIMQASLYADLAHISEGEEKEKYQLLLDFLTPVVKTYPTEAGIQSVSQGLQIFGGAGYCEDYPMEKLYRDIRITAIYEGTTGIQSQALLGRNMVMKNGKAAMAYFQEVMQTIGEASTYDELKKYAAKLGETAQYLQKITQHLIGFAMKGENERFLADATLYMEFFGIITASWQLLKQATVAKQKLLGGGLTEEDAAFYESKIHVLKYYFSYELPKTQALGTRLLDDEELTLETVESSLFV